MEMETFRLAQRDARPSDFGAEWNLARIGSRCFVVRLVAGDREAIFWWMCR